MHKDIIMNRKLIAQRLMLVLPSIVNGEKTDFAAIKQLNSFLDSLVTIPLTCNTRPSTLDRRQLNLRTYEACLVDKYDERSTDYVSIWNGKVRVKKDKFLVSLLGELVKEVASNDYVILDTSITCPEDVYKSAVLLLQLTEDEFIKQDAEI
jgi:hypothetical protein